MKGSIESLIRDKASVVFIALYLLFESMNDVATINELIRFMLLVVLVLGILYENHRHIEKTSNYSKGIDLIRELKDWVSKEYAKIGTENEATDSTGEGGIVENSTGTSDRTPEVASPDNTPIA